MQVDWVSGFVEAPPQLSPGYDAGRIIRLGPGGNVEREWSSRLSVEDDAESSFSRKFTVATPTRGSLYLSGNPVKLLQGHNAFGSCDAVGLFFEAGQFVREHAGLFPGPSTWRACQFAGPRFTRIDVTRSYRFPSQAAALAWIRTVAGTARDRRGAAKLSGGSTVVFGQGSARWSAVIYAKQDELLARLRDRSYGVPSDVLDWAAGVVRFEFRLRSEELQKHSALVAGLTGPTARHAALGLWSEYFGRLVFNGNAVMTSDDLIERQLSPHLRIKLQAWRGGADLRETLSRRSFYRVRRDLLQLCGVDIASPPPTRDQVEPVGSSVVLDPAGWDPEPIAAHSREPRSHLVRQYRLDV
jgi:hypothetical protein